MRNLRVRHRALACALFLAFCGVANASPRLPMADDGGRAARIGSSLIAEAMRFLGAGNFTGTRGPWCADAVSAWLTRTGHRPLPGRMAASALTYGPRTRNPKPGDLIVLGGRRGASHVGLFAGWDRGRAVMISGNWSGHVLRAEVSVRSVAAFVST